MRREPLVVVGAGPKAAALAAWAFAWRETRRTWSSLPELPPIHIYERHPVLASSWVGGGYGYSDGTSQELCTPSSRDVIAGANGPPRLPHPARAMFMSQLGRFSYASYCASHRIHPVRYPSHRQFADYVGDVLIECHRAGAVDVVGLLAVAGLPAAAAPQVQPHEVTDIEPMAGDLWHVTVGTDAPIAACGVVVTGPGDAAEPFARQRGSAAVDARYRDGKTYWRDPLPARIANVQQLLTTFADGSPHVVIVGAGGAAAAIALDLIQCFVRATDAAAQDDDEDAGNALAITFVAPQAGLFTRGESTWEDRTLTYDELWQKLSHELRQAAKAQLVTGVVYRRVLARLNRALASAALEVEPGKVVWVDDGLDVRTGLRPVTDPLRVIVERSSGAFLTLGARMIVNAAGFDARWFLGTGPRGVLKRPAPIVALMRHIDLGLA